MSLDERLARARADRNELAWVTRRLAEARADHERATAQLAIAEEARGYEQKDRDLARIAAAQLLCDELEGEVRAIDVYIAALTARERAVADAEARYAAALAEAETAARVDGALDEELDTIAVTEADLGWRLVEVRETIAIALDVQGSFTHAVDLVRAMSPRNDDAGPFLLERLLTAIMGKTSPYNDLTSTLAHATQGLRRFTAACANLSSPAPGLDAQFGELPGVGTLVLRDILWTSSPALEPILPEISRISSALAAAVGELRGREAALATALAECRLMRARLLDPALR